MRHTVVPAMEGSGSTIVWGFSPALDLLDGAPAKLAADSERNVLCLGPADPRRGTGPLSPQQQKSTAKLQPPDNPFLEINPTLTNSTPELFLKIPSLYPHPRSLLVREPPSATGTRVSR